MRILASRNVAGAAVPMARVRLHVAVATSLVLMACVNVVFLYWAASSVAAGARDGRLLAFMSSSTAVAARPTPSTAFTLRTPAVVHSVHTLRTARFPSLGTCGRGVAAQ